MALYQRWRARNLGARLDASTDSGFVLSDWNNWVKNQAPAAALAGIVVRPIDSRLDAEAWTVHDADRARRLQAAGAGLLANLRPSASDRRSSTAVEMERDAAGVSRRDDALELLVRVEGGVRAVDRIRAHYFKNHEIVFADIDDTVDACRTGLHAVLSILEKERDGDDSWIARLSDPSIPDEGRVRRLRLRRSRKAGPRAH